ncbi:Flavin-dependent oxidoreductase, luciferase family (includes alkanesulfonate monooxygenase SsuD and methylene tetrahydromethanopterin reductase) [Asanoa hainanensis]|uniref:Flavin-dependent oxidoreductase, luciferase family (Includes alkanesulfonate monooxygenase SsuD and methylene tetrahydromethanopterin reductase) n=1 Tax=Asanoa hainanensis TaxID=560556 RepID=A0A239NN15_9ACTN|nr:LLM class flavin-dependent oxidoreductase [Asanoa hainanensis]SNT55843.1 Flavin-dependent oxidoreductase, luciferase family (includes alkanesulfonate monooxygenase SsuD and methylene tetrahydromethanopterin reductase) [Asanoa hainanensis]
MTAEPRTHLFLLAGRVPGTSHAETLASAVGYALAAERLGFAGVWLAEHHFISYGTCPSAVALAAHLLGTTSRIRVGTAACVLSTRHPVALAEEAVLLDEVSGGRFALGVARGGPWVDLEVFGTGLDRFTTGFPESLDLLLAWLSGAPKVGADGPLFRFRPVAVVPRPRRPLPVWVAATSPSTVEVAAARGLPLLLGLHATDAEHADLLGRYRRVAAAHGHDPALAPHASAHLAQVGPDAAALVRARLPALLAGTREYVRLDGSPPAHRDLAAYTEHLIRNGAVGDAAEVRRRLAASAAATGVHHRLLMVEAAGTRPEVTANIEALAAAVGLGHP